MHAIGQLQVTEHHRSTADGAAGTDGGAAGHPHAPGHGRVSADVNVVTDLDQVVELHAVLDHGVVQRTPVDEQHVAPLGAAGTLNYQGNLIPSMALQMAMAYTERNFSDLNLVSGHNIPKAVQFEGKVLAFTADGTPQTAPAIDASSRFFLPFSS